MARPNSLTASLVMEAVTIVPPTPIRRWLVTALVTISATLTGRILRALRHVAEAGFDAGITERGRSCQDNLTKVPILPTLA